MYVFYCNNPADNLRAGDCVIRAISKITGDTWEKSIPNFLLKVMVSLIGQMQITFGTRIFARMGLSVTYVLMNVLSAIQLTISLTTTQKVRS